MTINNIIHTKGGIELVRKMAEAGERVFTVEEARKMAPGVGLSSSYLNQALHYLAQSGWIVRLKKGVYALSGSVPGITPLHEFEIAMALVKPAAISHGSALNYHGLTEQTSRRVFVLTSARSIPHVRRAKVKRKNKGFPVLDILYQFVQVKPEWFFGIEEVWVNESQIKMTDRERTLLDGIMAPNYCGDFAEVLHAFELGLPKLDLRRLIQYAHKLPVAAAKRLGWILEQQGVPVADLAFLQKIPVKGYRLLDPTGPHQGKCDSKWMIQVNLPGKRL